MRGVAVTRMGCIACRGQWGGVRGFAEAKKGGGGGGGKDKKSGGGANKALGPGDFPMAGQWGPVNLDSITAKDLPDWVNEEYDLVFAKKAESPSAGKEDRKFFKVQRKQRIKEANQRKTLGILD